MPTVSDLMDGLASQIQSVLCSTANPVIPLLQVENRYHPSPTPPAIDVYPSDPFTEQTAFGKGNRQYWLTVRARVSTADNEAGQDLLLAMMDDGEPESVEAAILAVDAIAGVKIGTVEGPTGFAPYPNLDSSGQLLGCVWRVSFLF